MPCIVPKLKNCIWFVMQVSIVLCAQTSPFPFLVLEMGAGFYKCILIMLLREHISLWYELSILHFPLSTLVKTALHEPEGIVFDKTIAALYDGLL